MALGLSSIVAVLAVSGASLVRRPRGQTANQFRGERQAIVCDANGLAVFNSLRRSEAIGDRRRTMSPECHMH